MKISKGLLPLLFFILAVCIFSGCSHIDKTDVEAVITNDLDLLKNLDTDTAQKYVSYTRLFPDTPQENDLSKEVKEVFSLFFKNFDYKVRSIDVDNDRKSATADLQLSTIDAKSLAKDYAKAYLQSEILNAASSDKADEVSASLEDRYLLLNQLLSSNQYETVERDCTLTLNNEGTDNEIWEINRTHQKENWYIVHPEDGSVHDSCGSSFRSSVNLVKISVQSPHIARSDLRVMGASLSEFMLIIRIHFSTPV